VLSTSHTWWKDANSGKEDLVRAVGLEPTTHGLKERREPFTTVRRCSVFGFYVPILRYADMHGCSRTGANYAPWVSRWASKLSRLWAIPTTPLWRFPARPSQLTCRFRPVLPCTVLTTYDHAHSRPVASLCARSAFLA